MKKRDKIEKILRTSQFQKSENGRGKKKLSFLGKNPELFGSGFFYLYYIVKAKKTELPKPWGRGEGGAPLTTRGPVLALEPFKRGGGGGGPPP